MDLERTVWNEIPLMYNRLVKLYKEEKSDLMVKGVERTRGLKLGHFYSDHYWPSLVWVVWTAT